MAGESSLMFSIPTGKEVLTANGETSDNLMQGYDIKKHIKFLQIKQIIQSFHEFSSCDDRKVGLFLTFTKAYCCTPQVFAESSIELYGS